MQTTKTPIQQRVGDHKSAISVGVWLAIFLTPAIALGASPTPIATADEVVHQCSPGLLNALDGGGFTGEPGPDGKGGTPDPGPDGNLPILSGFPVTSEAHADLAVAYIRAKKLPGKFNLRFCVVNRGGQPAHGPMTVQVRLGANVLMRETRFGVLQPRGGNTCFAPNNGDDVDYVGPNLDGTTISVTPDANEYSTRDNKCEIKWK